MLDLPSGTVTFLFTDIQGSTRFWERDRAAMAVAVVLETRAGPLAVGRLVVAGVVHYQERQ